MTLPLLVALLLGMGLIAVSSAAIPSDFQKQLMGVGLGLIPVVAMWFLGRDRLYKLGPWLYVLSILLLTATLVVGREVNGSRNWLVLGPLQFQPLELAKMALILALATVMRGGYKGLRSYLPPLLLFFPIFALVVKEDFGGAMVLSGILIAMLIVWRMPWWHLLLGLALVATVFTTVLYPHLKPYQQKRLTIFVNPLQDPRGSGYQVIQSLIAVGSGGMMGKGYKQGTQTQKGFVYSQHSDFVFSTWAEEQGFVGAVTLLVLFGALFWRLAGMAGESPQLQDQLVISGVLGQLGVQSLENIGATLSLLPLTGITLPLISYGLSSLVSVLATLGMVYVVHRDRMKNF
nr:FtsW/RodA/SpoVE family cell cycle protein [Deinobacterium chartae]